MRNINRMNDYFVRYLLGSIGNEDILENIVNCVLRDSGFQEVHNLEIINPHNLPENINLKESVLDVKAITKDNKKIIVEIQLSGNIDFVKRIFYYISKNIVSELNENESYDIISQVISINFVNFNMDFYDEGKAHRCFKLIDTENHKVSLDMMQMHIIEVPRFIKILNNSNINDIKKSKILSWIEFFTVKDLDKVKDKLKEANSIMSKVIDKYERFISSEEEMEVYNARDAFLYGQTLMLKKEREEGIKEGIEQGIERGIEKGEKNKALSIAKSLKKSGLDIKFISDNTGLSIDEVEKL
ncbi:Rpn family recombination-promoting nuclease/putative transposase [Brachyspira hyodysenteriae]|uniref:Rpn family recombination-promoting nuclease/putative transposase n=1 Tax=Brachyspira hyodysenteriae TaxID=159 RepID=UPI000A72F7B6|nr:Rpn family recombination-promoting nuclease/putative transposase [Brachyspira hyodysenteriae]AUJ49511.1 ATPase [Brachyspira hyodysenteriae]MDA0023326.1 Rpn family recombination-promoting nuclease/putative transposase [Brachyspira hyodysenteriae]MDA0062674.1 Rpn family recombination-promoting nuclease/putative transposase [Brachyspira hyodysenteriae]MDA0066439.1 Rpn family recombination-promoting nuclease/putative transposase [Brachyspira hyodysenteriae]MDA0071526.1 Rpn family recombination-